MKKLFKKIATIALTMSSCLCLALGGVFTFSQATAAKADGALETEFTNNGQFTVDYYLGSTAYAYEFVDGAAEGLPAGYNGAVVKIASAAAGGAPYINLDFTASKISASMVESVVARVYSPDYTSADELRINNTTDSMGGAGAYDLSTWCDVALPLATITGADGNLGSFGFGLRDKGTISNYFYIDSITVNMKATTKVTFSEIHSLWNNYAYDKANCTFIQFSGGISGNGNLDANFSDLLSKMTLNGQAVDTNNFSFYCPNWIGASDGIIMRIATNPQAGDVLCLPKGATFTVGGTDTNLYEITEEVNLQFNGTTWAVYENPAEAELAVFTGVYHIGDFNCEATALLQYSSEATWNHTDKGTLTSKVTLKNSKTGENVAANENTIVGWEGQKWIVFRSLTGYDVIEIAAGGTFGGVKIPALTLYNVNGRWVTGAPHAATTTFSAIAGGWNNSLNEESSRTILKFDVNPLGNAANATNLAATCNRTSMMVKYNGKTFAELYADTTNANRAKYVISYAHGNGYFFFSIPEADLVDGAIFEIEDGTPFMNEYLAATKFVLTNGEWVQKIEINYNPEYVSIGAMNHTFNETLGSYGLDLVYDTKGFAASGVQVMAKSFTGITLNGEAIKPAFWGGEKLLFWLPQAKCAAGYNGYKYATLVIEDGATVTNDNDEVFTLGGVTLYLVDGAWTTEYPALPATTFVEVETAYGWNNNTSNGIAATLLEFANTLGGGADATNQAADTAFDAATKIKLNGKSVNEWYAEDGQTAVNYEHGAKYLQIRIPASYLELSTGEYPYLTLTIEEGTEFMNYSLPAVTLYCINGYWATEKPANATANLVAMANGWNNAITNGVSNNILSFDVNPLGDASNATNLASSANATSLMVKYNGKSFFSLYADKNNANRTKYSISYAHGNNHFYFAIPEADLVDGAIFEIEDGTPFMNHYLQGVKLEFDASTQTWVPYTEINYNPDFVAINSVFNNDENGFLVVQFDTTGWAQNVVPTSYSGFTYNGNDISDILASNGGFKFYLEHSLWFTYSSTAGSKLVAGYNGYSHPTIQIAEGATVVYEGNTYTFHELTLYLVNDKWTTEKPDDYQVNAVFTDFNVSNVGTHNHYYDESAGYYRLTLDFNQGGLAFNNYASAASGITYNGVPVSFGGSPSGDRIVLVTLNNGLWIWYSAEQAAAGYKYYTHPTIHFENGATVTDANGVTITYAELTLYLVDGAWTTEKPDDYGIVVDVPALGEPDCVYSGFGHWNNEGGMTLFQFTNFVNKPTTTDSYLDTTGYYIELNGTKLTEIPGANVYTWENMYWLRIDIPNVAEGSILTIPEGTPFAGNYLPKLVFKLVDGVWCQAFTVNIEIDGETYVVYSQNDVPVVIGDEYFEKLLTDRLIPAKAVSFTVRGVSYPAGTTFNVLTDTNVTVQTVGFNTTEGASIRLNTPTGIRFETKVDKADYDRLVALYGEANVELGTYIMPRSLLTGVDFRSYFADGAKLDGTDYVQIVNVGFANKETVDADGYYLYYGSLVNLYSNNYCTDFFGIGYIKITDGENVYTVFGGYDLEKYTRNIYYVSSKAYNDYADGTTEKSALKSYLDGVVYIADEVEISNIMEVEGYTSPYSIAYNAQTNEYTVTGNAEIKSVMFGGDKRISTRTSTLEVGGELYYVTDYHLTSSSNSSTLTFKLAPVAETADLVDFTIEVPSNQGVKILQITDTELMDSSQARTTNALSASQMVEYARKNVYANCFNYITELVARETPDLIILTGDIINGSFDDNGTMWLRMIEFMDSLNIPWAPVFGGMDNESAMGAAWQRAQLASAKNCFFKAGTVTGNGDYTIGITDGGVLRRIIYMLDGSDGIVTSQISWMKGVAVGVETAYGKVPAFAFLGQNTEADFAVDFAAANIDGVFMGNAPDDNSSTLADGIYYTYGTKTGSYGDHNESKLGGTFIRITADGKAFTIEAEILDKTDMKNKEMLHLVETYDGSSVVTDAYLAPIWETNRIYDETGIFIGETGSVTLMFTPSDPKEVVVRDITLGVTYTYGVDYTISGNKVTRVAGGHLPYLSYDEYYMANPAVYNGVEQGWRVTTKNGKTEDGYSFSGERYMYYNEAYEGAAHHVTFTYNKTEAWTGTSITGDKNAQSFIEKLKTDKEGTVLFYGDSITVGCNASGTSYGGMRNPFLPSWDDLVVNSLEKLYGAKITKYNCAVGGWTTGQGAENLTTKVAEVGANLAGVDLFVIAFGMNDPVTAEADYIASIKQMINAYYSANPNGSVLLVSPMQPNTQSSMVSGNQSKWENALNSVKNSAEYRGKNLSLARVFTMFSELLTVSGKLSRDYLGNNINHPNDFGVRIYAQVILRTLCGDDFS